jgi:Genetic competence transcription factor
MNYEINRDTLAILPYNFDKSIVLEKDNEYVLDYTPYQIMENSCQYFGSSLEGRLKGTKNMLGSVYKAPILIEETRKIIFFPTSSPVIEENSWISLNNIVSYEQKGKQTLINFKNNKNVLVDIPYLSIENQVFRATRLESILRQRLENEKTIKND